MSDKSENIGGFPFVIGGLSFIPLVGVIFGLVSIVWGLISKKRNARKLAAVGAAGIAFTVLIYGSLFYFGFVQRGGIYDHLRAELAQNLLNSLVPSIELYKLQYGSYPADLAELQAFLPKSSTIFIADPMALDGRPRNFFYERVGTDHYYLRGVGQDGVPFTADDVLPQFDKPASSNLGLLIDPPANPAPGEPLR
jgi:hypothetical protein